MMICHAIVRRMRWAYLVVAFLSFNSSDVHAEPATRVVAAKYWNCMVEHAAAYGAMTRDPVIIFLSLCPTVQPSANEFAHTASNLGDVPEFGKSKISNVLVMTRDVLACVLKNPSQVTTVSGSDPTLGQLLEVNLAACQK